MRLFLLFFEVGGVVIVVSVRFVFFFVSLRVECTMNQLKSQNWINQMCAALIDSEMILMRIIVV